MGCTQGGGGSITQEGRKELKEQGDKPIFRSHNCLFNSWIGAAINDLLDTTDDRFVLGDDSFGTAGHPILHHPLLFLPLTLVHKLEPPVCLLTFSSCFLSTKASILFPHLLPLLYSLSSPLTIFFLVSYPSCYLIRLFLRYRDGNSMRPVTFENINEAVINFQTDIRDSSLIDPNMDEFYNYVRVGKNMEMRKLVTDNRGERCQNNVFEMI